MSDGVKIHAKIWRGDEQGAYQSVMVPARSRQTVLDVVSWVQRHEIPDLAYRFACRVGVCGSCAMTVDGQPRWTCRTRVDALSDPSNLRIGPLRNLPPIRDLVVDMAPFFDRWVAAGATFSAQSENIGHIQSIRPESPQRQAADAAIECINCGVCYAACDVVKAVPNYAGPAALNRVWTLLNDERQDDRLGLLHKVSTTGGCVQCHTHGSCTRHCPVGLDPSRSIAGLKRLGLKAYLGKNPL